MDEQDRTHLADLLREARDGKAGAWDRLFELLGREEELGAELLAIARRILPQGDRIREFIESRDIVQSALRSGWGRVAEFRGVTHRELVNWIHSIMRRKMLREVRHEKAHPVETIPDGSVPVSGEPAEPPDAELVRQELVEAVRNALASLPEDQQEVMDLRIQGLNAPEIAERLGLTPEAVRKRESRAAQRLREIFEPPGQSAADPDRSGAAD